MGGALTLRSAAGEGAEFRAALRLRRAPAVERHVPPLPAGARVLVADAAPAACAALARALGSWGFRVAEARTAAAVEAALGSDGTDPFRLVVVGGTLGDGDGVAFARRLQSRPAPVPLLLALPPDGAAAALRAEGAFLVVSKPVRARALEAAITRVAGACPAWPARTPAAARGPVALGLRVLVVEDNPVNRKVTVRMLEGAGCTAEVACDGDEGVRAFERGGWDAILMDCQMPNLDGFDATREIRRREAATGARRTPVIAVTANVRSGDRERCLAAGMDDHVPKPVRSGELVAALARWTERSRA